MDYRHTQTGYAGVIVGTICVIGLVIINYAARDEMAALIPTVVALLVITGVVVWFSRLTVSVAAGLVTASFGWGRPQRTIEVLDVAAFRQVRNKWYFGWGIRKVPDGWMYNVWGLDAVEIELKSGKKFRIGTDEPEDLLAMLALHTSLRPTEA